jgi:hypothetical protein
LRQLGESTTICNIVLAWVMTLPAAMLIAGNLDLIFRAAIQAVSSSSGWPPPISAHPKASVLPWVIS